MWHVAEKTIYLKITAQNLDPFSQGLVDICVEGGPRVECSGGILSGGHPDCCAYKHTLTHVSHKHQPSKNPWLWTSMVVWMFPTHCPSQSSRCLRKKVHRDVNCLLTFKKKPFSTSFLLPSLIVCLLNIVWPNASMLGKWVTHVESKDRFEWDGKWGKKSSSLQAWKAFFV